MTQAEFYRWHKLASVQVGGAICLPVILIGYELAILYGAACALVSIAIGNTILTGLGLVSSEMIWKNKKSTPENAGLYFGFLGKKLIAILLTCSMCGWFALQTQVVASDLGAYLPIGPQGTLPLLSVLFAGSLFYGLKGITKLADYAVPLMCATLAAALMWAFTHRESTSSSLDFTNSLDVGAISMVMALAIGVCIDMPTFFQNAATKKDSHYGTVATFLIGIPLIEVCGVLLHQWGPPGASLMQSLRGPEFFFWDSWIAFFLLFATWTTNTANLYSAAMGVASLAPKWTSRKVFLLTASLAVLISQVDLISRLAILLDIMGVLLASSFGVILMTFMLQSSVPSWQKAYAFMGGVTAGLLAVFFQYSLPSGVAVLDSALVSMFIIYLRRAPVCQRA